MILFFLISLAFSNDCPIQKSQFWSHYADEWGHEEKRVEKLKEKEIKIGLQKAIWVYLPKTCTKHGCDVSFLLQLPKTGCFKPMVSIQGRVQSFKKDDWSRFKNTYLRSSVDDKKKSEQIWVFDLKEKTFRQEMKATSP